MQKIPTPIYNSHLRVTRKYAASLQGRFYYFSQKSAGHSGTTLVPYRHKRKGTKMKNERVIQTTNVNGAKLTLTKSNKRNEWFRYIDMNGETYEMGFDSRAAAQKRYNFDAARLGAK